MIVHKIIYIKETFSRLYLYVYSFICVCNNISNDERKYHKFEREEDRKEGL